MLVDSSNASNHKETFQKKKLIETAVAAYTPAAPIRQSSLFSGRRELLQFLRAELPVVGKHFVIYGPSGLGKASLCNVLFEDSTGIRFQCSSQDSFVSIFQPILHKLGEIFVTVEMTAKEEFTTTDSMNIKAALPKGLIEVNSGMKMAQTEGISTIYRPVKEQALDLNFILDKLTYAQYRPDTIILDQFHTINSSDVRRQLSNSQRDCPTELFRPRS